MSKPVAVRKPKSYPGRHGEKPPVMRPIPSALDARR